MIGHRIGPAFVGLFAGVAIGMLVAPFSMRDESGADGRSFPATAMERYFIEAMVFHHEGAIAMVEVAVGHAKDPEIAALAAGIVEAQGREIEEMRAWYAEWFDAPVPVEREGGLAGHPGMSPSIVARSLAAIEAADDFDAEFVRQMIPHHEMAIVMARMLAVGSARQEMKALAARIVATQRDEAKAMKEWQEGVAESSR